jgi:DNA polymerase III, alpha subunit (EC 2.7.7.7)
MAEPRFVHLRVHSDYSMIDGLAKTGPLVKKAAALGMPSLAITDFTNLCGRGEVRTEAGQWRRV